MRRLGVVASLGLEKSCDEWIIACDFREDRLKAFQYIQSRRFCIEYPVSPQCTRPW